MATVLDPPAKRFALDFVERNAKPLTTLADSLFYFGELGMQEHRSAGLLADVLAEHGFRVERGISGFPTSFLATYGSGAPVIADASREHTNATTLATSSGSMKRFSSDVGRAWVFEKTQDGPLGVA